MKKIFALAITALLLVLNAVPATFAQSALPAVENLKVENVANRAVTLKWDAVPGATAYTVLYGTTPVVEDTDEYNRPPIQTENVTQYTVNNLTNGTKYYFNVFASNGQQISETLTDEVSATPTAEGTNAAPTINGSTGVSSSEFNLEFSKEMNFPANLAAEINIVKSFDESKLNITNVTAVNGTTLKVTTSPQDEGAEYRITVSDKFTDKAGVPVPVNERSDILIGKGSTLVSDLYGAATGDLKIVKVTVAPDKKAVELEFNKSVVLEENATQQIAIVETASPADSSLKVTSVLPNKTDDKKVLVVTDELKPVSYTLLALRIKDKEGNLISEANSTIEFMGSGEAATGSGAEVTDLEANFVDIAKLLVNLTWGVNPSINASTLKGYKIYLAEGVNGTYEELSEVGTDVTSFDTESLNPADMYKFKVTSVNADGTESDGALVELELPGTGPAGLIALALSSLGLGGILTRRKN